MAAAIASELCSNRRTGANRNAMPKIVFDANVHNYDLTYCVFPVLRTQLVPSWATHPGEIFLGGN